MNALGHDIGGEGPDTTAGEYVLGVLDADARADFAVRLTGDAALRREVETWEARLSPWAETVAPVTPPPLVWAAVERAMDASRAAPDTVVVVLRQRLRYWRFATGASLALAAAIALTVFVPLASRAPTPASPPAPAAAPQPIMMASLAPASGHAALFMATFDPGRHALMIAPAGAADHPGHAPELWLIPKGGKPVPLGMAGFGAPVRLELASDMVGEGRTTLAVSLEPPGGSPTGQPTGPVIATGELKPV